MTIHNANPIKENEKYYENTCKSFVNYKTYMFIICFRDFT